MAVWLLVAVIPALVVAPSATSWLAARCMPRATWRLTVVEAYRQKMDAGLKEPLQGPWAALLALFALGSAWTFLTPTHGLVRVMCLTILLNTALPLVLSHLMMVHILRHGARASAAFTLCMLILAECSQSATALAILAVDRIN